MGFRSIGGSLWAELRRLSRSLWTYALTAAVLIAPFFIGVQKEKLALMVAASVAFGLALCVLGLATRLGFVVACLVLAISAMVHQHVTRRWGGGQLDSRIEAILESPPGEIRQYLESHVDVVDVMLVIGACLFSVALVVAAWRAKAPSWPLRLLAMLAVVTGTLAMTLLDTRNRLKSFPPVEPAVRAIMAFQRYEQLEQRSANLERKPVRATHCNARYDKVVIVIGESAVTDRMGVFGYRRPTTPFAAASGAHAFEALAPSNQTRYSLGMMFTDAAPGAFESFYTSHSLVGQLGACGYETTWVSNQGRRGEYDSYATSLALEANEQVFLNEFSWNDAMPDGHLVDEIARRGLFERARHATFIHLLGSHTDYGERYPEGFGFEDVASVENQYDNSILYTDHVLSELHRRFAGGRLLFIYASDHGQIVSENHYGSGFLPGFQDEFRTPLLVWSDDADSIVAIRGALGGSRMNLESFDEMVRYLLGMTAEPRLSTSSTVSVLVPENVRDYKDLAALVPEK